MSPGTWWHSPLMSLFKTSKETRAVSMPVWWTFGMLGNLGESEDVWGANTIASTSSSSCIAS